MKKLLLILLMLGATCRADVVTATLILEAGGEGKIGMQAVMEVIHNRSIKRNKSYQEVCLQRKQFSCWNGKNIEATISKARNHPHWNVAKQIASKKPETNLTKGADHYHADYVNPYWSDYMTKTVKIKRHIFYK